MRGGGGAVNNKGVWDGGGAGMKDKGAKGRVAAKDKRARATKLRHISMMSPRTQQRYSPHKKGVTEHEGGGEADTRGQRSCPLANSPIVLLLYLLPHG